MKKLNYYSLIFAIILSSYIDVLINAFVYANTNMRNRNNYCRRSLLIDIKFKIVTDTNSDPRSNYHNQPNSTHTLTKSQRNNNVKVKSALKMLFVSVPFLFLSMDVKSIENSFGSHTHEVSLLSTKDEIKKNEMNGKFEYITLHSTSFLTSSVDSETVAATPNDKVQLNPAEQVIVDIFDKLKEAYLVDNVNTFVSVSVAEGLSGILAGLSSRKFADFLNDKKKDSLITKLFSTGIFFGGRSFFRTFATFVGVPRPIALVVGSLSGTFLSELSKYVGRITSREIEFDKDIISGELIDPDPQIPNTYSGLKGNLSESITDILQSDDSAEGSISEGHEHMVTPRDLMSNVDIPDEHSRVIDESILPAKYFVSSSSSSDLATSAYIVNESETDSKIINSTLAEDGALSEELLRVIDPTKEVISKTEIAADITRWLVFDELESLLNIPEDPYILNILTYFGLGGVSATAGYALKRLRNKRLLNENETLWKDAFEGGILFSTYSCLSDYLMKVAPKGILNQELPFYSLLQNIEADLEETL